MSQLREATKLSASSIYWHFQSKEGVMAAMLERGINRYLEAAEAVASRPYSDGAPLTVALAPLLDLPRRRS